MIKNNKKDFDKWNELKKETNSEETRLYTVREVWWCRLGVNVGSEQDGSGELFLRPVVIVRAFGPSICLVIPLTASLNKHPLRVPVGKIQEKFDSFSFFSPPCGGKAEATCTTKHIKTIMKSQYPQGNRFK